MTSKLSGLKQVAATWRVRGKARAGAVAVALALLAAAVIVPLRPTAAMAAVTEYNLGNTNGPNGLTLGPDGNVWVAETDGNGLARVTPAGVITKYAAFNPYSVVTGPDG